MTFAIGDTVGPYRITDRLGHGGMATVFRAYHANLDRYVAIKVLHAALKEDPTFITRFKREAQIVARLEHPNIIPIYDYNEQKGEPYLVMKFIEGETLKARLARAPLKLDETLRIMTAVGSALTYAHECDVLHRDIKPSNILIDKAGEPFLADFGLARMASAGESTMSQDMMLGTPHYISPEQAQGTMQLDAATDIYSLGVVLYEIVVGRVPFTADTPFAIVHDHIFAPLPLPSKMNPNVPAQVERVLLRALAKNREDRYKTAVAMIEDFNAAVSDAGMLELSASRARIPAQGGSSKVASASGSSALRNSKAVPSGTPTGVPKATAAMGGATSVGKRAERQPNRTSTWIVGALILIAIVVLGLIVAVLNNPNIRAGLSGATLPTLAARNTVQGDQQPSIGASATARVEVSPTVVVMGVTNTPVDLPPTWTATATRTQAPTTTPLNTRTPTPTRPPTAVRTLRPNVSPPGTPVASNKVTANLDLLTPTGLRRSSQDQAQQYVDQNPSDVAGYFALGILKARNDLTGAIQDFRQGVEVGLQDPPTAMAVANQLDVLSRRDANPLIVTAEHMIYVGVYTLDGNKSERNEAGQQLYDYADGARRINAHADLLATAANELRSASIGAFAALALLKAGDRADAKQYLSKALEIDKKSPEARLVQGILYAAENNAAAAKQAWDEAAALPGALPWLVDEARKLSK